LDAHALTLMNWFSPAFPVGAFAYSHGLEWAQEAGDLTGRESLEAWIGDLIRHGAAHNDVILLAESWRALTAREPARSRELCELALALSASAERRLETTTQGNAFIAAIRAAYPSDAVEALKAAWPGDVAYPVAVGAAAAGLGLPLAAVAAAFVNAFAANLVSAAVRLGIVGQTDGQRVIADLAPLVSEMAREHAALGLDDLGSSAFRSDLAALRHETQYSRLFRS
jgi:urease accessory protein